MSKGELKRLTVINGANAGFYTVKEAAQILKLGARQIQRLKKGVKEKGPQAVIHGNRGRAPTHALPEPVKDQVYNLARSPSYQGANFSHFRDLLEERENLILSVPSVWRILKARGLSSPKKHRRAKAFRSRPRKEQEGMMVLIDASPHDWLEGRDAKMNLHALIDDATGKVLGAFFRSQEDLIGYFQVLKQMILKYGVPLSLYSDRHSIFISPKHSRLSVEDQMAGVELPLTQFGRALEELGVTPIRALTPQAKGRVERLFGTLQDRLRIEMRLHKINGIEEANAFLPQYLEKYNLKFAVKAQSETVSYQPAPRRKQLRHILCLKVRRRSTGGSSFSFGGKMYQLQQSNGEALGLPAHKTVMVHILPDGSLYGEFRGQIYRLKELKKPERVKLPTATPKPPRRGEIGRPAHNHPWRRLVINPEASKVYREKNPALLEKMLQGVTFS